MSVVRPRFPLAFLPSLLAVLATARPAAGQTSDDEADPVPSPPAAATAPRTGKPVAFDRDWLEPFFKKGPAKQAAEQFRAEAWPAAEAGFEKALRTLPRKGDEHRAASYLLALARSYQSKWAEAGKAFEELHTRYQIGRAHV